MKTTTKLSLNPLAEVRYVIPVDTLNIRTQREAAALHVAEHWLLEGFGDYQTADEAFGAVERLGGELSASTSRKFIQLKISYFSPWHKDAARILDQILQRPRLESSRIKHMIAEVVDELSEDDALTHLFYRYYRDTFTGRYSWSDGGTPDLVRDLDASEVRSMGERVLQAPVKVFYAGAPNEVHSGARPLGDNFRFAVPTLRRRRALNAYRDRENGVGLLPIEIEGDYATGLALHWYLKTEFQDMVTVQQHVLPGLTLRAVEYHHGAVAVSAIKARVEAFRHLQPDERQHYLDVAACTMQEYKSDPTRANDRALDEWVAARSSLTLS